MIPLFRPLAPFRCGRPSVVLGMLVGLTLCGACSPDEVQHPSWDPLTEEEIDAALKRPTGTVDKEVPPDLAQRVEDTMPGALRMARFFGHLALSMEQVVAADFQQEGLGESAPEETTGSSDDAAFGSSFFVRIACPGETAQPPFDFANGQVVVESPELGVIDKASLLAGGDFLLRFDACRLGASSLSADFPGRYVSNSVEYLNSMPGGSEEPLFAFAMEPSDLDQAAALGVFGFACGSATTSCLDDVRVAIELRASSASTFVMAFRATSNWWSGSVSELAVSIRGANETSTCTFQATTNRLLCD